MRQAKPVHTEYVVFCMTKTKQNEEKKSDNGRKYTPERKTFK